MSDAFFAQDREWCIVYVNYLAERFWEKPQKEFLGKNIWDVLPQVVGTESYQVIERAAKVDSSTSSRRSPPLFRAARSPGRPTRLRRDFCVFPHISEHKRAEEALIREREIRASATPDLSNGSVNVLDRDLRYLLAEGKGTKQVGLSPEMLVGKALDKLFPKVSGLAFRLSLQH
jgi:PAS domain-containing protein